MWYSLKHTLFHVKSFFVFNLGQQNKKKLFCVHVGGLESWHTCTKAPFGHGMQIFWKHVKYSGTINIITAAGIILSVWFGTLSLYYWLINPNMYNWTFWGWNIFTITNVPLAPGFKKRATRIKINWIVYYFLTVTCCILLKPSYSHIYIFRRIGCSGCIIQVCYYQFCVLCAIQNQFLLNCCIWHLCTCDRFRQSLAKWVFVVF